MFQLPLNEVGISQEKGNPKIKMSISNFFICAWFRRNKDVGQKQIAHIQTTWLRKTTVFYQPNCFYITPVKIKQVSLSVCPWNLSANTVLRVTLVRAEERLSAKPFFSVKARFRLYFSFKIAQNECFRQIQRFTLIGLPIYMSPSENGPTISWIEG